MRKLKVKGISDFVMKVLILILIIYIIYIAFNKFINYQNRAEKFVKTDIKFKYEETSNASFYIDDKNIFFATKDGVQYVNDKGKLVWKDIYNLTYPILKGEGNNILITENKGNALFVYNSKGKIYEKTFEKPILHASLNNQGYCSVILQDDNGYEIGVFNNEGVSIRTIDRNNYNIFPISTDISNDNRILAISFFDITEMEPSSKVIYFNLKQEEREFVKNNDSDFKESEEFTDEESDNETEKTSDETIQSEGEGMKAARTGKNQMISLIKFMKNNTVVSFSDKEIVMSKEENKFDFVETAHISLTNKVERIDFYNDLYLTVCLGKPFLNEESEPSGIVRTYDMSGKIINEIKTDGEVTYLSTGLNSIIIGQGFNFKAYTMDGNILWEHNSAQIIKQILFYRNTKTILQATSIDAAVMKQIKVRDDIALEEENISMPENIQQEAGEIQEEVNNQEETTDDVLETE